MNLSLSVDNIFHRHNQVFHFHRILLDLHLDSLVHTTIKLQPLFISTISIHFLLHLNHQSSIQHHLIRYLVIMSVFSFIIQHLHLFSIFYSHLQGYSFSSHQYPFQTIVVSLKFTGYVQSLSLGSQSNVQQYGLRTFNPSRNVDDTYYSSIDPNTGDPIISNIPMAKVAVRLYINLYTTNDGRPPSNIQLNFVSDSAWERMKQCWCLESLFWSSFEFDWWCKISGNGNTFNSSSNNRISTYCICSTTTNSSSSVSSDSTTSYSNNTKSNHSE